MRHPMLFSTLRTYNAQLFRADLAAGITVAMVALPLSIAIAIASGAGPAEGLVTAVVAGFIVSALGGSRVQIGGPTGAFIVVVYGIVVEFGYDGLVIATFLAGLILLVAGWLRAGRLIRLVPEPVIDGFTLGIAAIIATSQIPDALGLSVAEVPADFLDKLPVLWAARETVSLVALGLTVTTILLIVLLGRLAPRLPGLIIAVAISSAVAAFLLPGVETVGARFGVLPDRLPWPKLPDLSLSRVTELLPSAFVIAFLAGIESLLSAIVADRMVGIESKRHRPNAELIAQGAANVASSLFGGLPATGAIARTATNIRAGGRTPVAGIVHALTILLAMMLLSRWAGYLALSALAGLLFITAWNMSEPHRWRERWKLRLEDKVLLVLTFALTLLVDLTVAIGVGVALGLALRQLRRDETPPEWTPPERQE